jgi:hypothetical protein
MCNEQPVRHEAAQQRGRNDTPLRESRCFPPQRSATRENLIDGWRQTVQRAPEGGDVEHALEVGRLFKPCSLTTSELRIDEYELWADGLRLHDGDPNLAVAEEGALAGYPGYMNLPWMPKKA